MDEEIGIEAIPPEVFLNVGEITEQTAFDDLEDITWSWQAMGKFDLRYVYNETYLKEQLHHQAYKTAAQNAIKANREYRYIINKALKAQNPKRILQNFMDSFED